MQEILRMNKKIILIRVRICLCDLGIVTVCQNARSLAPSLVRQEIPRPEDLWLRRVSCLALSFARHIVDCGNTCIGTLPSMAQHLSEATPRRHVVLWVGMGDGACTRSRFGPIRVVVLRLAGPLRTGTGPGTIRVAAEAMHENDTGRI